MVVEIVQTTIAPIIPLAGATIVKSWNDPTQPGEPAGSGFGNSNVFGAGTIIDRRIVTANEQRDLQLDQIIPEGNQISVGGLSNNVSLQCTFHYRVRATRD